MTISPLGRRALGLALGVLADQFFADPPTRFHPVAWFGSASAEVEKYLWRDHKLAGLAHTVVCLVPVGLAGFLVEKKLPGKVATTALATWVSLGAASLAKEGNQMAELLKNGDLEQARNQLMNLCGRDPQNLDEAELARAVVESLAENTADCAVASVFWLALAGIPGILIHRAANTLDAMVGHKNNRYLNYGYFSAKFDDLLDWVPARITGLASCLAAGFISKDAADAGENLVTKIRKSPARIAKAWRIMNRDARNHPSPNGGWCEAGFAGCLGIQLGGTNTYYGGRVEHRGLLGQGPRPGAIEIGQAARLVKIITTATAMLAVLGLGIAGQLSSKTGSN